jgi:hypothetical protein
VAHPEFSERTGRLRIKQKYASAGPMPLPWFPPKWGLDTSAEEFAGASAAKQVTQTAQQFSLAF